jgi:hypothetical protein
MRIIRTSALALLGTAAIFCTVAATGGGAEAAEPDLTSIIYHVKNLPAKGVLVVQYSAGVDHSTGGTAKAMSGSINGVALVGNAVLLAGAGSSPLDAAAHTGALRHRQPHRRNCPDPSRCVGHRHEWPEANRPSQRSLRDHGRHRLTKRSPRGEALGQEALVATGRLRARPKALGPRDLRRGR